MSGWEKSGGTAGEWMLVARSLPGRFPAEAEEHKRRMAQLDAEIHRLKLALMGLAVVDRGDA